MTGKHAEDRDPCWRGNQIFFARKWQGKGFSEICTVEVEVNEDGIVDVVKEAQVTHTPEKSETRPRILR